MTTQRLSGAETRRRHLGRLLAVAFVVAVAATTTAGTTAAATAPIASAAHLVGTPNLGANVTIFDPSMSVSEIQATLDATHAAQVNNEMGTNRYAYLFKPGVYGSATEPLAIKVGYYTEIAGLGASPEDVTINGKVEVYNRCVGDGGTQLHRAGQLLADDLEPEHQHHQLRVGRLPELGELLGRLPGGVDAATQHGGANLSLMDYCTAGPQFASGGFIADSRLPFVINGSQQQWLIRNSVVAGWSNAVWNQVFTGVEGAPTDEAFPNPPYTTLDTTPLSRERPYLFVDDNGAYKVRVPSVQRDSRGITWGDGETPGRTVPLSDFFIAKPSDSELVINLALALGKNLLLTPGVYNIDRSLQVWRPNTVVLGLGHPTLTAVNGATPLEVASVPGIVVAGVTIDAGLTESPVLLRVGRKHLPSLSSASNPVTPSDVYFRVGGPHVGKTKIALEINSDNVLIDHTWVWRADHGVEGFTDTERWNTNTGRNGAVINGDNVTANGLFVEHFQQYNTIWNGNKGTTILYQNELPYDPPTEANWMNGSVEGYAGYKVGAKVKTHTLYGAGVYVFNQNNPSIHTENGFEVPETPGVKLHHIMTVNLSAGIIDHVVNGVGDPADTTVIGQPRFINDYPVPAP